MYYIYILRSLKDGSYYKGRTIDLIRRLIEHNKGKLNQIELKTFYKLIHVELVNCLEDAIEMELYFKSGTGREVIREIDID